MENRTTHAQLFPQRAARLMGLKYPCRREAHHCIQHQVVDIFACEPFHPRKEHVTATRPRWLTATICFLLVFLAAAQGPLTLDSALVGDWITKHQLGIHPSRTGASYLATNEARGHKARIDGSGFELRSTSCEDDWVMDLRVLEHGRERGRAEEWAPVSHTAGEDLVFTAAEMQVQYLHGPEGLRQNFIIQREPKGEGALVVRTRISGSLTPKKVCDERIEFLGANGDVRSSYAGLLVWDACGEVLPSRLELDGELLAIVVDDRCASYPITIDPVATTPNRVLAAPVNGWQFGRAVSTAGDLNGDGYSDIVVGVHLGAIGESGEGVAYVYYGSATGIPATPNVILQSNQVDASFGYSVSNGGDVNGDGYGDLFVGAQTWESEVAHDREGAVFVFHGSATGITTTPSAILEPNTTLTYMGYSVACAGDINNDGYSDMVTGAPFAAFPGFNEGAVYVFLGSPTGLNPIYHKRLERNINSAQFGVSVTGLGDVNGDGYSDIAASGHVADFTGYTDIGVVCVYHGSATGLGALANPNPNRTIRSIDATYNYSSSTGWCVSKAGDLNGDGYSDMVVGDWRGQSGNLPLGPTNEGSVLVFHGSPTGIPAAPAAILDCNQSNSFFGRSVATAGDVNGDGYADLIVGSTTWANPTTGEGAAWLYLGSPTGVTNTVFIRYELDISGGNMGESVSSAGDVNGDGYSDILVGLKLENRVAIYHGGAYNIRATPSLTRYSGVSGFQLGNSAANAGDVNGDGYSDLIVGAPGASNGQAGEGLAYVHYGSTTGLSAAPNVTLEANIASAAFGTSVCSAGDIDGDGYSDVIVGAPNSGGTGAAYIFHGGPAGLSTSPTTTLLGTATSEFGAAVSAAGDIDADGYGDVIIGAPGINSAFVHRGRFTGLSGEVQVVLTGPAGSRFGAAVATAGDVDGTGFSDVIVGAPNFSNGQTNEGAAFVYHGGLNGIPPAPAIQLEPNLANSNFGTSVAGAGDVNGNGYFEVVVGAPGWASGQAGEGAAFTYYGSPSGITLAGMQTTQPNVVNMQLGRSVAEAGDVNGDGYADIVLGAPGWTNVETQEGRVYVVEGSPTGLAAITTVESNILNARMGTAVAGGGDVNGDGYSDIIGGAPGASPTFANEGAFLFFGGNQARSLDRRTRQLDVDLTTPLSTNSVDFTDYLHFGIGHRARSPIHRTTGRLVWEVVFEGQAFSGVPITNSVAYTAASAAYTDLGLSGAEIRELVTKVPGHIRYKWRARVEYPQHKLVDGQRFSRWFYGYASGLGDIGILPVELLDLRGVAETAGNQLFWSTASESGSDRFEVERSPDARHFHPIGSVEATGNSRSTQHYGFMDRAAPAGISYYRLRMVDTNGSHELSNAIAVMRASDHLRLFPNPANDVIAWQGAAPATKAVVRDAMGKQVLVTSINADARSLNVSELPDGHYTLELLLPDGVSAERHRFIKAQAPIVR